MKGFEAIRIKFLLDKQKFTTGIQEVKGRMNADIDSMKGRLRSFKREHTEAFRSMKNEVPGLGRALSLLKNPYVIAAAGIAGIGAALNDASEKAALFQSNFRQLKNLNLDKSESDYKALEKQILNTAYRQGFDKNVTSTAFYDVQSVTGKYGKEVEEIVERQGEFAKLLQANMSAWISGTAKGMANYGFGVDRLDEFNRSAFATVKVGVTTFDQLAQVMPVYSGAAAAAKQNFDSANKMLALFTVRTKSVDEAATLTKSLFNDLTKENTIKSLRQIGISMYDNAGAVKQADTLLLELQQKFRNLDDSSITALKNSFTGSEGLIAFIQSATDQTDQLKRTFEDFNKTQLDLNKLRINSNNDYLQRLEESKNRMDVLLTKAGEKVLPIKLNMLNMTNDLLNFFVNFKDVKWFRTWDDMRAEKEIKRTIDFSNPVSSMPEMFPQRPEYSLILPDNTTSSGSPSGSSSQTPNVSGITDSAKQIRNVTVNIGSFIEELKPSNTVINQMSPREIEELFNNMFLKLVRNLETSQ